MPPFVLLLDCQQARRVGPARRAKATPYPPFVCVGDPDLSAEDPVAPDSPPPHAVNDVATNMANAVARNAFLRNESKLFIANSSGQHRWAPSGRKSTTSAGNAAMPTLLFEGTTRNVERALICSQGTNQACQQRRRTTQSMVLSHEHDTR